MKPIIIANPLFPPEPMPSGEMCFNLAKEFSRSGDGVTVISGFPNRPKGVVYDGFFRSIRNETVTSGFRLIRCFTWLIGPKRKTVDRLLENLSFGIFAGLNLVFEPGKGILLVEAWPVFCSFLLALVGRIKKHRTFYFIQDLLPEQAEQVGMLPKGGFLSRFMLFVDRLACRMASGVFVLSPGMKDWVAQTREIPLSKIEVVPIQIDLSRFPKDNSSHSWRKNHGYSEKDFLILFSGTLGFVSGLDILADVLPLIPPETNLRFVIVGEGPLKPFLSSLLEKYPNLKLLPYQADSEFPKMLQSVDLTLLPMKGSCGIGSVPSKMYSYMAAGKPVLSNAPLCSENARIIRTMGCGELVAPDSPNELARALIKLSSDKPTLERMGKAGRNYIEENCTVEQIAKKLHAIFSKY